MVRVAGLRNAESARECPPRRRPKRSALPPFAQRGRPIPLERDGSNQKGLFGKKDLPLGWGRIYIEGWKKEFQGGLINPITLDWEDADEGQSIQGPVRRSKQCVLMVVGRWIVGRRMRTGIRSIGRMVMASRGMRMVGSIRVEVTMAKSALSRDHPDRMMIDKDMKGKE